MRMDFRATGLSCSLYVIKFPYELESVSDAGHGYLRLKNSLPQPVTATGRTLDNACADLGLFTCPAMKF
jgi:hypothetical protein